MPARDPFPNPVDVPIARDRLAFIVLKARAYDAQVPDPTPEDSSNWADDRAVEAIYESGAAAELAAAIQSLDEDARAALVALFWVGRGDYGPEDWSEACAAARRRREGSTARYLMGSPLLGDLLEEGADQLGVALVDEEQFGMHNPMTEQPAEEDRE